MMQWKSALIFISLLALGCSSSSTSSQSGKKGPYEQVKLIVGCTDEQTHQIVQRYARHWAAKERANVEVKLFKPLKPIQSPIDPPSADVWIIAPEELGHFAMNAELREVPDSIQQPEGTFQWLDVLRIYREQFLKWDRRTVAMPVLGATPICYYRRDLFEDQKHQDAYEKMFNRKLDPPKTWQEYRDQARYFFNARKQTPSLPALPTGDHELTSYFYTIASSFARQEASASLAAGKGEAYEDLLFSFYFDLHTGEPRLNKPGFVAALELIHELKAFRDPKLTSRKSFAQGNAVLCPGQPSLLSHFEKDGSVVQGKVGVCLIPGSRISFDYESGAKLDKDINRVPYLGAEVRLGVVPQSSQKSEAAFALLSDLGGINTSQQIVTEPAWGGGPTRRAHWSEEWHAFGLVGKERRNFQQILRSTYEHSLRNPVLPLRVPRQMDFQQKLAEELKAFLSKEKSTEAEAKAALTRVVAHWNRIIKEVGASTHRDLYRVSLGLAPSR